MPGVSQPLFETSNAGWLLILLLAITGCGEPRPAPPPQTPGTTSLPASLHARTGPHGGALLALGSDHVELTYDDAQTRLLIYFIGADATSPKPLAGSTLSAQVKTPEQPDFRDVAFTPLIQDGEQPEQASRFVSPPLPLKSEFEIVLRLHSAETVHRAQALLDPGAIATSKFVCPMRCNNGKTYSAAGNCPVCSMKLVEVKAGSQEHSDHRPRHGGVFFMSADNWHHLEGVFAPPDEFRLYLYNNFTRPIDAAGFDAVAEFAEKGPEAPRVSVKLQPGSGSTYLMAKVPAESAVPPAVAVRIKFKAEQPAELFNFSFSDSSPPLR